MLAELERHESQTLHTLRSPKPWSSQNRSEEMLARPLWRLVIRSRFSRTVSKTYLTNSSTQVFVAMIGPFEIVACWFKGRAIKLLSLLERTTATVDDVAQEFIKGPRYIHQ